MFRILSLFTIIYWFLINHQTDTLKHVFRGYPKGPILTHFRAPFHVIVYSDFVCFAQIYRNWLFGGSKMTQNTKKSLFAIFVNFGKNGQKGAKTPPFFEGLPPSQNRGGRVATRQVGFLEGVIFGVRFWLDFWSTFFSIFDKPQFSVERWFFTFLDFRGPIFDITFWAVSRSKMSHFWTPLKKFNFLTFHGPDFWGPPKITFFQLFWANRFFIKIVLFLWSNSHPVFAQKWSF